MGKHEFASGVDNIPVGEWPSIKYRYELLREENDATLKANLLQENFRHKQILYRHIFVVGYNYKEKKDTNLYEI